MRINLSTVVLLSVCWLARTAPADLDVSGDQSWHSVQDRGGVEILLRPVEESTFPEIRGSTRYQAPIDAVFHVVSDYDHFAGFVPLVAESRVIDRDATTTRVYQRLRLPLPFADRHYVIAVEDDLQRLAAGVIEVRWQLDAGRTASLTAGDALTPRTFSGAWRLRSLPGGGCDAQYTIHVDPAGAVPSWLFLRLSEGYVGRVMRAVRGRLEGRKGR